MRLHGEGQRGGTKRLARARHGAHREIDVGHFFVRARQLTSQAKRRDRIDANQKGAWRVLRVICFWMKEPTDTMTSEASLARPKVTVHGVVVQLHLHSWTWKSAGGVFALCGGIIAPIVGSILTAIAWFTGPVWHGLSLHRYGTVLLLLTIPLLLFGAHCLDLVDKEANKRQ